MSQPVSTMFTGARAPMLWFLMGRVSPNEPVRPIPIHTTPFVIGRLPSATFSIANQKVSSLHSEIYEQDGDLFIRDRDSTNGTFVNGQRISQPVRLRDNDLVQFGESVFRLLRQDADVNVGVTDSEDIYDRAMALVQFDRLLKENAAIPHYQPIVDLNTGATIAYEVQGRSRILGLETATSMFNAARQLNMEKELSSMLRFKGVEASTAFAVRPHLFVKTHHTEVDLTLVESLQRLRALNSCQELTLEIHAAAVTAFPIIKALHQALKDLKINLAYDDFGAGQNRIIELAESPPDFVKYDMSLVRGIDRAAKDKQQMMASLVNMVRDLNAASIAYGVETVEEANTCRQLGFELAQGFYFGRPTPVHRTPSSPVA